MGIDMSSIPNNELNIDCKLHIIYHFSHKKYRQNLTPSATVLHVRTLKKNSAGVRFTMNSKYV